MECNSEQTCGNAFVCTSHCLLAAFWQLLGTPVAAALLHLPPRCSLLTHAHPTPPSSLPLQVEDAVVMYDHENKRPRGFGFITFAGEGWAGGLGRAGRGKERPELPPPP